MTSTPTLTQDSLGGLTVAQILDFCTYAVTFEDGVNIDTAVNNAYAEAAGLVGPFTTDQIAQFKRQADAAEAEHMAWMDGGGRDERPEDFEDRDSED